ncbi:hypothetical protein RhiirA1_466414 [Rhizophagus irregularis]|uniref:Uncharacterized protein n=1 Tax=Rhizophagus irregularis TaxID=588596 RepID=A0A2N0RE04_9GLOM|nr:hypothetical protein RhiirA1_466414 [Rhizophagus irregularis]
MIDLDKIFEQLNVLESVHIIYCISLNNSFTHQIFNLAKPFKLKSLFIDEKSQIDESLKLLLQKSGGYLENIGCKYSHKHKNYLSIDLIENIKQNLNYLSINANLIILRNLGQALPFKLKYLRDSMMATILSNEVKEFELYNIKIRYYDIRVHEFIKEMD